MYCISARIFIILKLRNIHWSQFIYAITLGGLFPSCIKNLPNCYSVSPSPFNLYNHSLTPNWSFREHLSRSLPTKMIFYLLRSIRSECLTHDFSGKLLTLDTLEVIIKWLQVIAMTDKVRFVFRALAPSDRATCTIDFKANFRKALPQLDFEV